VIPGDAGRCPARESDYRHEVLQIYLKEVHCAEETDEVGADEPYVLVVTVNLASTINVAGFPVPVPAFEVFRYGPFDDMDEDETHAAPGISQSFWGVNGQPADLTDPDQVIFIVAVMENDNGDPEALRGIVKGEVGSSVLGSLAAPRAEKVTALLNDVNSALGTPTGAPNFDDQVGFPQELRFSNEELATLAEPGQTVIKTLHFNGDGGQYRLAFEGKNPETWRKWFQVFPEWTFNQITPVAVASRSQDHIDLFKVGFDGAVWSAGWHADANGWWPWFQIHAETVFAQEAPVTAISRVPDHLDLFITGFDGAIWSSWWHNDGQGWRPWFQIHPETVFRQDRPVAAIARWPEHLDLFRVGFDGAVWTSWWHGEGDPEGWRPWFQIHPEKRFPVDARVTAIARRSDHIDLFVVGEDGAVWSTWWHADAEGWRPWFPIDPETVFRSDQEIVAVARVPEHLDLFTVGHDGAVWSTWWHDDGQGWRPWFQIHPSRVFSKTTRVTALARRPDHLDLFITGLDGAVWSSWWHDDAEGWRPWFRIHPEAVFSQEHPVTAVARFSEHIDLFKVGFDDRVWSAWWSP
jgi:hypothetical protein